VGKSAAIGTGVSIGVRVAVGLGAGVPVGEGTTTGTGVPVGESTTTGSGVCVDTDVAVAFNVTLIGVAVGFCKVVVIVGPRVTCSSHAAVTKSIASRVNIAKILKPVIPAPPFRIRGEPSYSLAAGGVKAAQEHNRIGKLDAIDVIIEELLIRLEEIKNKK